MISLKQILTQSLLDDSSPRPLWSNLQLFELTKELTNSNSGIKNHPIISSAYAEWGLLNSGKPMAAKAIKAAEKRQRK